MGGRLLSLALVVMVGIILALSTSILSSAKKAKKDPLANEEIWAYEAADQLLSRREFLFFQALEQYLAPGFRVFPKVRLMSFVTPSPDTNLFQHYRSRIGRKYVDFLIVDGERLRIKAAVEYDENGPYSLDDIVNIINAGGFYCGVGDWRTERDGTNGAYHVEIK